MILDFPHSSKKNRLSVNVNLAHTKYPIIHKVVLNDLGWNLVEDSSPNWDLLWTDHAITHQELSKMVLWQRINHFPGMAQLSRKNMLAKNLQKMKRRFPQLYNFFPRTWTLPLQYPSFKQYAGKRNKFFIAKPEADSQGRGIFLFSNPAQIKTGGHYVVQQYLNSPLLFHGLKFDMRIYVLVLSLNPPRVFIYKEGLVRLATERYRKPDQDNFDNKMMHLTNYAINKLSEKYVQSEARGATGHKRPLTQFFEEMQDFGIDIKIIWKGIKEIIQKALLSALPTIYHQYKTCQPKPHPDSMCFQLLGFDIMLDRKCKPYLLEINHTPSFATQSQLDKVIKRRLIKQTILMLKLSPENRKVIQLKLKKQQKERIYRRKEDFQLPPLTDPSQIGFFQEIKFIFPELLQASKFFFEHNSANTRVFRNPSQISSEEQQTSSSDQLQTRKATCQPKQVTYYQDREETSSYFQPVTDREEQTMFRKMLRLRGKINSRMRNLSLVD